MVCIHCPLCCMRHFPTFIELKKHLIHYAEGDLKCPFCDHHATGLQNLILHLNVHDDTDKFKDEKDHSDNESGTNMVAYEEIEMGLANINSFGNTLQEDHENLDEYRYDGTIYYDENEIAVARYMCGMCEIEFESMDLLRNHAMEIHAVSSSLIIDGCTSIHTETAIQDDTEIKGEEDNADYLKEGEVEKTATLELKCDQCGKQFDKQSSLELHRYIHMDRSQWPLECTVCHKRFITRGSLNQHSLTEHSNTSDLQKSTSYAKCNMCGKIFKSQEHLHQHKQEIHEKYFKCDVCNKVFDTDQKQKRHKVIVHVGRKFLCTVCGKKFHFRSGLRNHSKTHMPVRPYPCNVCEKSFVDASELRRHMLRHTGEKPHVCEVCGEMFRERYRLNVHMRSHTGERPYACTKCNARFTSGSSLRLHKLIHVEGKSYQCKYCSKVFKTPINLYNHMNLHIKPFKCDVCSRSFSSRVILRKHQRTHFKDYNCEKCKLEFTSIRKLEAHEKTCGILEDNNDDSSQFIKHEENLSIVCQDVENNSFVLS